jgi:Acyl-CoA dehydrogenase, C-terminal domain
MLIRRGLKGELPLVPAARRLQDEVLSPSPAYQADTDTPLGAEIQAVAAFRKVALIVIGTAMQTYGDALTDQQEVLGFAADVLIDTFAADSAVLRAREAVRTGHPQAAMHETAARLFVTGAAQRVEAAAKDALAAMAEGDTLRTLLAALRRVLKIAPVNAVVLRRQLADAATARGGYILNL